MAKGKNFLGLKRGSTKSTTYQVLNGQQVVKDRVYDVKNPRTNSQMVQRMCMATVSAAYQHMKSIVDHSFEGVSYGQNSYSVFVRSNIKNIMADVENNGGQFSYNPYKDRRLFVSPFVVSRGSLHFDTSVISFFRSGTTLQCRVNYPNGIDQNNTMGELCNALGLLQGDIITACFIYQDGAEGDWRFGFVRLMIDTISTATLAASHFLSNCKIQSTLAIGENLWETDSESLLLATETSGASEVYSAAILSRHAANKWLRSSAQISLGDSPVNTPTADTALATYPIGKEYVLNGGDNGKSDGYTPAPEPESPFVDLGLPSGTLWAKGNIVKNGNDYAIGEETDYGCYFSWGNIDGYNEDESYDFSESFYNTTPGAALTADISPTDKNHDAAAARIGSGAHMPTIAQIEELIADTDNEWATINGINGYKFMKKTDHEVYVFLPAAGCRNDSGPYGEGSLGYYRSSSIDESDSYYARIVIFDNEGFQIDEYGRYYGIPVRPVFGN